MDRDYFEHAVDEAVFFGTSLTTRVAFIATSGVICMFLIALRLNKGSIMGETLAFEDLL